MNADGYDDVVVGAPEWDGAEVDEGRVYLYFGSGSGLGSNPVWVASSGQANAASGSAVGSAGDVNGDGYDDLVVGAGAYTGLEDEEGRVEVYFGSSTGPGPLADWTVTSGQELSELGLQTVGSAGDVNGDGYDDLILAAPAYDAAVVDAGQVSVYLGSATGPSVVPAWTASEGSYATEYGAGAIGIGDIDADGYADIAVGAPGFDNGESNEGRVFVYRGGPLGPGTEAAWTVEANQELVRLGKRLASGDVNGDGLADLLVATESLNTPDVVTVFLGAFGLDSDGDGVFDAADRCPGYDDAVVDGDGDGSCTVEIDGAPIDCADDDPTVYPGAPERCDGVDSGCVGAVPADELDGDLDGWAPCAGDCNDGNPTVFPGAPEACDGVDSACAGAVPADETDADLDGVRVCDGDCDDENGAVFPGAPSACDGVDNACAGSVNSDEVDQDGDGYRGCDGDCDDGNASIYPGAPEQCDGVDSSCTGVTAGEQDADLDGVRGCAGDCDDADPSTYPGAPQQCDGVDNTCAGVVPDDERDADLDGVAACAGDCDDADCDVYPGAPERCDGVDNTCAGAVPAGEGDRDGDGALACDDCDDADSAIGADCPPQPGCGCAAPGLAGGAPMGAVVAALVGSRRRRRPNPRVTGATIRAKPMF